MTILTLPDWVAVQLLASTPVVECGAGTGLWLRIINEAGGDAIGLDPNPRGPGVLVGNHTDLAQYRDRMLLIVWPPDGSDLDDWISAWGGRGNFAVCGQFGRFQVGSYPVLSERQIHGGQKFGATFRLMQR